MNELPEVQVSETFPVAVDDNDTVYLDYLADNIPTLLKNASVSRLASITDLKPAFPEWYLNARSIDRQYLKELINERWRLQDTLDKTLGNLQKDIKGFAEPLLVEALKEQLNLELDVNATSLRLYVPAKLGFGTIDTNASRLRQSTLLEAALHNFEAPETLAGAFRDGSGVFITDAEGAPKRHELTVEKFAALCRTLDIGAQYQQHITALLDPEDNEARAILEQQSIASERAAFNESALIAYLKKDIASDSYGKLQQVRDDKKNIRLGNRPMHCHRLSLMGFKLTGIVLFSAVADPSTIKTTFDSLVPEHQRTMMEWSRRLMLLPGQEFEQFKLLKAFFANGPGGMVEDMFRREDIHEQSRLDGTLIAYVPDDPDHPLKEYASFSDFMKELTSQLRTSDYQQFFSRFVAKKDQGRFFSRVRERLTTFIWTQREPLDMGPWWRETAVENPDAEPITNVISGNLWPQLSRWRRDKAIADARQIAVPTDDEDSATRWNRLTSYLDIGWNVFNFGAMLVPGLGEAMLATMVGQMLFETMEGIEEWSKGDKEEAAAHLTGVMINFAQLAIMAAGHVLPGGAPAPVKPSSFIDQLKRVELPDGKTRLWNADLTPYEHDMTLPKGAQPSEQGLYRHSEKDILKHENRHFVVSEDPHTGQPRLLHPNRPGAYQPKLEHNGAGAWKTELDSPIEWDKTTLMRRLGPAVEGFSDATLEQIRIVSGVEEDVLRRLHVVSEPPPALLVDTIKRFNAWADAGKLSEQILENRVSEELVDFLPPFMTELPRWPGSRAIEVFHGAELRGRSSKYGNVDALEANTIKITRGEVKAGKLPEYALKSLDEAEVRDLLGRDISRDDQTRIKALQGRLAMVTERQRKRLFDALYKGQQHSDNAYVLELQDAHGQLPTSAAEALLADVEPADLQKMVERKRLPLALRERVRAALLEVRLTRAYEGLFLESLETPDTERLALHSLAALPNWPDELRIEIREYSFTGTLHDSIGPVDAPERKILVINGDGNYEARDADDLHLHGPDNLFASVLHVLPDAERNALGYEINQGATLRQAIQNAPLARDALRPILEDNPVRKPAYDPQTMKLRGGMQGYPQQMPDLDVLRRRVSSLYPAFSEEQVESLLGSFGDRADHRLSLLETEFNILNSRFQTWVNSPTAAFRFSPEGVSEWNSRNQLHKAIRQCWQRTGPRGVEAPGVFHPQGLVLEGPLIGRHLVGMPELSANFDHVTVLILRDVGLLDSQESFLRPFGQLRSLTLTKNRLTSFPQAISEMRFLVDLVLNDNQIRLTDIGVAQLKSMTRLRSLGLSGNPLGLSPDISRMPNLQTLTLDSTGLDSWPTGLFAQPRPRSIYLNLRYNPISRIPEVAPGSFRAELLARTFLSREPEWISADNLEQFKLYIESVGLEPDRPYPPRSMLDSSEWAEGISLGEWHARQEAWDAVEDEFGSEPFFKELRKLTESADFRASNSTYRNELTAKVWRMLEAMERNTELRESLFAQAVTPTECADGGTQLFNAMGVEVLVHEAYGLINPGLVEAELVTLARGKSRLNELGAIARHRVAERLAAGESFRRVNSEGVVTGTIDEVEVHLAYMTDLAARLDLPWQSRGMLFRRMAGVSKEMIEAAYERVLALEQGELLAERILEQPFWETYLEEAYRQEFDTLRLRLEAENADEMVQFSAIKDLAKSLTRQASERAKLQRVDIPFTVEAKS